MLTDFKRVGTNFDAVKDKVTLCQSDIKEFVSYLNIIKTLYYSTSNAMDSQQNLQRFIRP